MTTKKQKTPLISGKQAIASSSRSGVIVQIAAHTGAAPAGYDENACPPNQDPFYTLSGDGVAGTVYEGGDELAEYKRNYPCSLWDTDDESADMSEIAHTLAECARLHILGMAPGNVNRVAYDRQREEIYMTHNMIVKRTDSASRAIALSEVLDLYEFGKTVAGALKISILFRDGTMWESYCHRNTFVLLLNRVARNFVVAPGTKCIGNVELGEQYNYAPRATVNGRNV